MKEIVNTFVDWRPIASIPIENRIIHSQNWVEYKIKTADRLNLVDGQIKYRFSCRNDGFFVFQVHAPASSLRGIVFLAAEISHKIKADCGHFHVLNNRDLTDGDLSLSTLPIICTNDTAPKNYKALLELVESGDKLKTLTAYSIRRKKATSEPAVLALKKLYSSLFDRASRRTVFYDENINIIGSRSKTYNSKRFTGWAISIYTVIAFIIGILNYSNEWGIGFQILKSYIFITISAACLIHLRKNIGDLIFRKIKLQSTLIGYCYHGNNLSRVLWQLFDCKLLPPNNDFDPIIAITELRIQTSNRQLNAYYFSFSFAVGVFGLFVTLLD